MTSLPPKVPKRLRHLAQVGEDVGQDMINIRILGYLIHFVPTDRGLKTVVQEIGSCEGESALLAIGKMYYDHYIRAFRANKGRIPTPSNHASRPSFNIADVIKATLVEAPQSHIEAKKNALIRDGYRCVVTGKYDTLSVTEIRELNDLVFSDPSLRSEPTQCAYIFAESTNSSIESGSAKVFHRLENVMTLTLAFHAHFDQLSIWFVATDEENKYKLEAIATKAYILRDYPEYVTFTTPDAVKLLVPSATYLAIHAACAKVAHLSGAGECIDKFYRDMEDGRTLDPNGASAEMLEHAIFELQASGYEVTA
ncbi:hypothetical protein BYT27DRAFT_7169584 [Phlegmacium glaucopus]|nr:hypothetical protein BYT27DRAFT_7169584 [Phlegmacium glaucopus]